MRGEGRCCPLPLPPPSTPPTHPPTQATELRSAFIDRRRFSTTMVHSPGITRTRVFLNDSDILSAGGGSRHTTQLSSASQMGSTELCVTMVMLGGKFQN